MKSLTGKFVIRGDHDSFRTGVVKLANRHTMLVQYDMEGEQSWHFGAELICMDEVIHVEPEPGMKLWSFFDTRAELDAYLTWLDEPRAPSTVVKMVPKPN